MWLLADEIERTAQEAPHSWAAAAAVEAVVEEQAGVLVEKCVAEPAEEDVARQLEEPAEMWTEGEPDEQPEVVVAVLAAEAAAALAREPVEGSAEWIVQFPAGEAP